MNCLVKRLAIADGLVYVLVVPFRFVKLMGWFGGTRVLLPDKDLIRVQNLCVPALKAGEETVALHLSLAAAFRRCPISVLRAGISGSDGLAALFESRSEVSLIISGVREGSKFLLKPAGMDLLAASSRILLNRPTARAAEVGGGQGSELLFREGGKKRPVCTVEIGI